MTFDEWRQLTFAERVLWIDNRLKRDILLWSHLDRAAAIANGAHESGRFILLQEIRPTVAGSKGGFGWFQWTGPRRRDFEAYCAQHNLAPTSPEANYSFFIHEITNTWEKRVVAAVSVKATLSEKVVAFEMAYERAGIKHYDNRQKLALEILEIIENASVSKPSDTSPDMGKSDKPTKAIRLGFGAAILAIASALGWCAGNIPGS